MDPLVYFEFWLEDPQAGAQFFQRLFDWQPQAFEGAPRPYYLTQTKEEDQPGINGAIGRAWGRQGVINTIEVEDLDFKRDRVLSLGGQLVTDPLEIPGVGRHCYAAGPDGLIFGMMEPIKK
ncbi:MAG: hypothetical protein RRB13_09275 [bacterium]|nr:hypothetical protein [bacterium]